MKFLKTLLALVATSVALLTTAKADPVPNFTMHVDTTLETLWFSGSTSGTTENTYVSWISGESGFLNTYNIDPLVSAEGLVEATLYLPSGSDNLAILEIFLSGEDHFSVITGTEVVFDYSGASSFTKAYLATATSMSVSNGSEFSDLQIVQVSSVPEPSTYAAILGGVVLVGAVIRRKRK